MKSATPYPAVSELCTIGEAARLLGVSEVTLRRWDRDGKFSPHRHPMSGYRLYKRADVVKLRKRIEHGGRAA
jgi:DNA (cytosine-5)-methyltransferase 1